MALSLRSKEKILLNYCINYYWNSKMKSGLVFFFLLILETEIVCFPPSRWATYTPGINSSNIVIMDSKFENIGNDIILYTSMLDQTSTKYTLQRVNASASPPTLLTEYTQNFTGLTKGPQILLAHNSLVLAYHDNAGDKVMSLNKTTLSILVYWNNTFGIPGGVYLQTIDVIVVKSSWEYAIIDAQINMQFSGFYNSGTSNYFKIKYLYTQDQKQLFAFYTDKSYFLLRNITTSAEIKANFSKPAQISLGQTGYQCACLKSDDTALYILLPSSALLVFNTVTNSIQSTIPTAYTGISKCYYDSSSNGIVFVSQSYVTKNSTFKIFSLASSSELGSAILPELYLNFDWGGNYGSMCSATSVYVYLMAVACTSSEYYDYTLQVCEACPVECATCTDAQTCTSCVTNYILNGNGLCVSTVSNTTNSTSSNTSVTPDPTPTIDPTSEEVFNQTLLTVSLAYMMNNSMVSSLNQFPGGRKVFPFLCFLVNLDELWLYQYHERDYGDTMNQFFKDLQTLESEKWKLLGDEKTDVVYGALGTSRAGIKELIDTKHNYTYPVFFLAEGKGETFLPACWDFLTFNLLFVVLAYFLLRIGFTLLFHYRISIFLRAFSFLIYLSPLLLDGNLQYFFFLMFSQSYLGFSIDYIDKTFNVVSCLLYFFILWFSVVSCFLAYYMSRKLSKYILDNWRTRVNGLFSYSLSNSLRMVVFAAIHSLLRQDYDMQLKFLMGAQVIYIVFMCLIMRTWRTHKVEFKVWFNIIFASLRICLLVTLYIQQQQGVVGTDTELYLMFQNILGVLLNMYMMTFYGATATEVVYEVIELFKKPKKSLQENKLQCQELQQQEHGSFKNGKKKNLAVDVSKTVRFQTNKEVPGKRVLIKPKLLSPGVIWMVVGSSTGGIK